MLCSLYFYIIQYVLLGGTYVSHFFVAEHYLEDESNMDSHERSCVICGCDISDTPHYYTMCNHCYKESLNRSDDHDDTTVSSNYEDSSSDPSDGFDDEWGFYNIYGEFPDWKKKK